MSKKERSQLPFPALARTRLSSEPSAKSSAPSTWSWVSSDCSCLRPWSHGRSSRPLAAPGTARPGLAQCAESPRAVIPGHGHGRVGGGAWRGSRGRARTRISTTQLAGYLTLPAGKDRTTHCPAFCEDTGPRHTARPAFLCTHNACSALRQASQKQKVTLPGKH